MSEALIPQAQVGAVRPPRDRAQLARNVLVAAGAAAGAWAITIDPLFAVGVAAAGGALYGLRARRRRRWREAWVRDWTAMSRALADGRLREAEEILIARERISTNAIGRAMLAWVRGAIVWERGDLDGALGAFRRCVTLMPRPARGCEVLHARAVYSIASLQLELGRLVSAREAIERALLVADRPGVPPRGALETHHALAHDQPEELGDADALRARAAALRGGGHWLALAVIGWAYERRGDRDEASRVLAEASRKLSYQRERWQRIYPTTWARLAPMLEVTRADE
jgi:tetratricopeptide (TPR) repeat protein